jgi:hypothetical protein
VLQILADCALDADVQHLDDDFGAVVQRRRVHLSDGAGTQRLGLEGRERLLERGSELCGHDARCDCRRIGRHRALRRISARA